MSKSSLFLLTLVLAAPCCWGANYSDQLQSAAKRGQTTYVMFHRDNGQATQKMAKVVQSVVQQNAQKSTWVRVNLADPSGADLVRRFDATRVPMPAVFGLAPNGAVTGVYRMKVLPNQLQTALLTRGHAEMVKALQDQKIVINVFQPAAGGTIPTGVQEFCTSPNYAKRVQLIQVRANQAEEMPFFARMKVNPQLSSPVVQMYVPPGNYLGTFNSNVTASILSEKFCSSGKCNCHKCQQQRQQQPRSARR